MDSNAYELVAMGARYLFVFLGVLIVLRSYGWLLHDRRMKKRALRALPDAGMVGEIVDMRTGKAQPLPHEGIIGSSRACDIRLHGDGIRARHASFLFVEKRGVRITPYRKNNVEMDGVPIAGEEYALHGTRLLLGDAELRVRLFAGLDVPRPMRYARDEENEYPDHMDGELPPDDIQAQLYNELQDFEQPQQPYPMQQADYPLQPPAYPAQAPYDPNMTWQYAPIPQEMIAQYEEQMQQQAAPLFDADTDEDGDVNPFSENERTVRRRRAERRRSGE